MGIGVFKGVPGEGKYDMALESLYKSSTYFFTLFSLLYIYRGVTNYGGKYKCFELFCLARNIMVIRAHDGRVELRSTSRGLLRIL